MANQTVERFKQALQDHLRAVEHGLRAEMGVQIGLLDDEIRRKVPVETGALRDSIYAEDTSGNQSASYTIHAGDPQFLGDRGIHFHRFDPGTTTDEYYDYVRAIEFGTGHAPARPFFFTTYRARREGILSAIRNRLDAVVRAFG